MTMRMVRVAVALAGVAMASLAGRAQNTTGTITGRLTDPTGAVVPAAQVTVENTGTTEKRVLTTGQSGDYTATLLLPGMYRVTAQKDGFETEVRNDITLVWEQ